MMLFQCCWTTVTLISACTELMLDVFTSIGEDVMVGVGCTARRDACNSDLLKIDDLWPTYAWTHPRGRACRTGEGSGCRTVGDADGAHGVSDLARRTATPGRRPDATPDTDTRSRRLARGAPRRRRAIG